VGEKEGSARMEHYLGKAEELRRALDCMWRGDRYVRVLTEDGREMTRVNALVAGWSILSGASDFERGSLAMETALRELERENLVQLFSPPYSEDSPIYPGRMADYPAGVRENGGQYSHGVSWLVDGLLVLAETARDKGLTDRSLHYRSKAMELWRKISPLVHLDELTPYGLPPHQQPADVSYGPGYEGRGGWSWYTGAAARMLCAAYGLFGLRIEDGKLIQPPDLHESKGSLTLRNLEYKRSHPSGE
jgi:cyclic beta-1,2-glucan synthetase